MSLAAAVGIDVAPTELKVVNGKDVLLVERFDILQREEGVRRRHLFSALTALGLDELTGRDAEYPELASFLRKYGDDPEHECLELYRRMVFNMAIGNTDDHARNHAVFWDGSRAWLTPAYDLCVFRRVGQQASQAMQVGRYGNVSTLANALSVCERFLLNSTDAKAIHDEVCEGVASHWKVLAESCGIGPSLVGQLEGRSILSPYLFQEPLSTSPD